MAVAQKERGAVDDRRQTFELPAKPTLRIDEAQRALGCSDNHVRHLVEDGSLAAVDIRCKGMHRMALRIMTNSVVEFLEKRRTV